jgi:very-short-patch-repair endonuclease
MKFYDSYGKIRNLKTPQKYLIDWSVASRSKFQNNIKNFIKDYWVHDVVFEEFRVVGSRLSLDFYNANKKIAIEVQGDQHVKYVKHFHKNRMKYLDQLKRDQKKLDFCEMNGIKLVEIYSTDVVDESFFNNQDIYL